MSGEGELRQRKPALQLVKELDAFPKLPDDYQETSPVSGGMSIVMFVIIGILVISEIRYYSATELEFDYEVDSEFDKKLKINIDMTVAMPCRSIGADVLDLTGQNMAMTGKLEEHDFHFDLSPDQRAHFETMSQINEYLRDEYHAVHKFLWRSGYGGLNDELPPREDTPTVPAKACRLVGSIEVNKVAGNFHITAGKSVPVFPRGHAHMAMMVNVKDYNFSHQINHISFGEAVAGKINPLDGEEKIIYENYHMYQYFIQVVPTRVDTMFSSVDSYQFAVTERNRTINHSEGSHGVPGIFIKYDLSSLKVHVRETHKPYWQLFVRLCGIIGGIFSTSGMIHGLANFMYDTICCKYGVGRYKSPLPRSVSNDNKPPSSPGTPGSHDNSLLNNDTTTSLIPNISLTQTADIPT